MTGSRRHYHDCLDLELTRFRGHLNVRFGGVHDGRARRSGTRRSLSDRWWIWCAAGRTPASLAKEFGPTAWTIALWVKQDARDAGKGDGGLTTAEREELTRLRRENRKLKEEREILSKAAAWFATESGALEALFGFVKVNQATHPVGMMCRLLKISRSGFYAWLDRPMCAARASGSGADGARSHAIHRRSRETYGSPNIHAELADDHGIRVGPQARGAADARGGTARGDAAQVRGDDAEAIRRPQRAVDLVERQFYADGPDRLWVADITYIPTWCGLSVPGDGAGCVLAQDRRLGDGDAPAHRADAGGARTWRSRSAGRRR